MTEEELEINRLENNYKLFYEASRKDLDILLSSSIIGQKNLMKTIMWINFTLVGLVSIWLNKTLRVELFYLAIPIILLSSLSIISILLSLTKGRDKVFGQPHIDNITNIENDEYSHLNAIYTMISSTEIAFNTNTKNIISPRASSLSFATKTTILSSIFVLVFIAYASVNLMKGGENMANDKKKAPLPSSVIAQPSKSISTNSEKSVADTNKPSSDKQKSD